MPASSALSVEEPLQQITDANDVPKFAAVIASAFSNDALNRYLYLGRESHADHPKLKFELRVEHWKNIIQPRFEGGGLLVQSHDWAAVALWLPPGIEKPPITTASPSEGIQQYVDFFKTLRKEKLGDRPHWHLNLLGRDPKRSDRGVIRAIFDPVLSDAKAKNLPVWLEATNAHAREVYEHFGFKIVGEIRIGKGIVGSDGWLKEDGEGVLVWGLIAGLDGW